MDVQILRCLKFYCNSIHIKGTAASGGGFSGLQVFVSATTSPTDEIFMANAMIFYLQTTVQQFRFRLSYSYAYAFFLYLRFPSYAAAFCSPLHNISLYLSLSSFRIQISPFSLYLFSFFLFFQQCSRCICTLLFHSFSAVSYPLDEIIGMLASIQFSILQIFYLI